MKRYLCIHAHFYQPPRENPWLEAVERQDSAYPYHDWNERVAAECYGPNTASRILGEASRISEIVNNYAKISFNFGPTLLSWLEAHRPEVYEAVVEADREGRERFSGHGPALAQVYNHMIMPLANRRDKQTQIVWGIRDFEHRFGRKPEGMWLAETAVDLETLDLMARHGISFTILAPRQAHRVRKLNGRKRHDVSGGRIDPRASYVCNLPSGRSINLFFYDGPIAQDVAFGGLLNDGGQLAKRLTGVYTKGANHPELAHIATDGETYGHHHPLGDMALAYCLHQIEAQQLARLTVYGEYLERNPPVEEVEIYENSSWSCAHGIERWRSDCGCSTGSRPDWSQAWRTPLREALDTLRDAAARAYEREVAPLVGDPWQARDEYIDVILDRSDERVEDFLRTQAGRWLGADEKIKALKLLELQRNAMLMYTSCGWFFDDISGIETVQILQYAARVIQLTRQACGLELEDAYIQRLRAAQSNRPEVGDGAALFEKRAKPTTVDLLRVGAHYALSSLFEPYPETAKIYAYTARSDEYERREAGRHRLALGTARIKADVTWDESDISFAVLHLGDHNVIGGVRELLGEEPFSSMRADIEEAFLRSDIPQLIRLIDQHFGKHAGSLWQLFGDERRKILEQIHTPTLEDVEGEFRQIFKNNYPMMNFLNNLSIPLPKAFRVVAEYTVSSDLLKLFRGDDVPADRLKTAIEETAKWSLEIDRQTVGYVASAWINTRMEQWSHDPANLERLKSIDAVLSLLPTVDVHLDLWRAQNIYFSVAKSAGANVNEADGEWLDLFTRLGEHLQV